MSQRDLLRTALRMGLRSAGYRVLWELDRKSGLKALRTPVGGVPIPREMVTHAEWRDELPAQHLLRHIERQVQRASANPTATSAPVIDPSPRWHLEPNTGREWPLLHWTEAIDADAGDLRTTWEPSRFVHVWDMMRASRVSERARVEQADLLAAQLGSWREQNPFRAGVHWASGQELALRSLSWLTGFAAFGDYFDETTTRSLVELLYWHGVQIESEFGLARRSIANNHVLAESFALAALGDALPGFEESDRWRKVGLDTLIRSAPEQFSDDGGYCQASMSYQRFALELLLWAERWFPEVLDFGSIFASSLRLLETAMTDKGEVPNFGPNDSARAFRVTAADINDFRPLVALLRARLGRPVPGDWPDIDEACGWLGLGAPARATIERPRADSFPEAGLHLLRAGDWFAMLRCGELPVRGGHSDALHLDVRFDGRPLAIDPGSASYTGPAHEMSVAAASHNGVTLDGEEPRRLVRRFTWADGPQPRLQEYDARRGLARGTYDLRNEVSWERTVEVGRSGVRVSDRVSTTQPLERRVYRSSWLLDVARDDVTFVREGDQVAVSFRGLSMRVTVRAPRLFGLAVDLIPTEHAPRYGETKSATRLIMRATAPAATFITEFEER